MLSEVGFIVLEIKKISYKCRSGNYQLDTPVVSQNAVIH